MIEQSTKEQRGYFLLQFTKQLIRNTKNADIYFLEQILNQEYPEKKQVIKLTKQDIRHKIQKRENVYERKNTQIIQDLKQHSQIFPNTQNLIRNSPRVLKIPEPNLPERLNYLKPSATEETIEVPKLQTLIQDQNVKTIESEGPNTSTIVTGTMGRKKTGILLANEDIQEIFQIFSQRSKIPLAQGITKIAVGNLILTAIKSNNQDHFIIRKIPQENVPKPSYA